MAINVTPDIVWSGNDVFETTSFNVPVPSGLVAGQILILGMTFAQSQTNATSVTVTGSGAEVWTSFGTTSADFDKYAFWKVATTADVALSTSSGNWICNCQNGFIEQWSGAGWNGVNTTTPFAVGPTINIGSTLAWSWNSLTSPGTGSVWAGISLLSGNSTSKTDPTPPPTNQVQSTSGSYFGPATIYSAQVNSGAFAPSGSEGSAFEWSTVAFFLNPSGGGGGDTFLGQACL